MKSSDKYISVFFICLNPFSTFCLIFCSVPNPFNRSLVEKLRRMYLLRLKDNHYIQGTTANIETSELVPQAAS